MISPGLVAAWPPLRQAARMIGVAASSLSRRPDLTCERRGREQRVSPAEVLRLARYYKRRPLGKVASELLDFAYEHAPDQAAVVDQEIELTLGPDSSTLEPEQFLLAAQRGLPPSLYAEVERAWRRSLDASSSDRLGPFHLRPALRPPASRRDSVTQEKHIDLEPESSDG
jgi:hypothetical protein